MDVFFTAWFTLWGFIGFILEPFSILLGAIISIAFITALPAIITGRYRP